MNWEEQLKIEKGMKDKVKALIKRMKDASFKRKMKKFLSTPKEMYLIELLIKNSH